SSQVSIGANYLNHAAVQASARRTVRRGRRRCNRESDHGINHHFAARGRLKPTGRPYQTRRV
ncbi:MAG: hypothetical protein ACTHLD_01640, partial [Chitinophaga sp.]